MGNMGLKINSRACFHGPQQLDCVQNQLTVLCTMISFLLCADNHIALSVLISTQILNRDTKMGTKHEFIEATVMARKGE